MIPRTNTNLSGILLLANPKYTPKEDVFSQRVIAVLRDQPDQGSMGLVLNDPLKLTLDDFNNPKWNALDGIPVFKGGPVEQNRLLLTAIEWSEQQHFLKWYLGLGVHQASQLISHRESVMLRAYCGYVGWSPGQLQSELNRKFWLPVPVQSPDVFFTKDSQLWHKLMLSFYPFALSDFIPANPSLN